MSEFAKALVQPMLWELRKAIAGMRAGGATEDEVRVLVDLAAREVERQVDNAEHRAWLTRQIQAAARKPHEGAGTGQ